MPTEERMKAQLSLPIFRDCVHKWQAPCTNGVRYWFRSDSIFRMRLKVISIAVAALMLFSANIANACEFCKDDGTAARKQVPWDKIEFHARKLVISASSLMEWSILDTEASGVEWVEPDDVAGVEGTPIEPGKDILRIAYNSDFLGTHYYTVLWVDPKTGAILQYETSKDGRKAKHRVYRFTNMGVFQRTWRPEADEKKLDWHQWTDQSGDYRPFQHEAQDQIIVDTLSLVYLVTTSDLGRGVNRQDYLAYGDREISRAVFSAAERADVKADFYIQGPGGEQRCRGKFNVLKIDLDIQQVGDIIDPDFGFLTEIELYITPDTRLPVILSGRAEGLGNLVIKAKQVFTSEAITCPEPITN